MKRLSWCRREPRIEGGEKVLFAQRCSWAPRARWISLVGGAILVTSRRIIFTPNLLAAILGRRPWALWIGEIESAQIASLDVGRPFGSLPALHISLAAETHPAARTRTVVMRRPELLDDLAAWINRSRWRT